MEFTFKNGVRVFIMNKPMDRKKIWLMAYHKNKRIGSFKEPIEFSADELVDKLNSLRNLDYSEEVEIDISE